MQKMTGWGLLLGGIWTGFCSSVLAQPLNPPEQQQWLLQQMRLGQALYREDLVRDSLRRLELIAPDNPQAQVARVRQALLQDNPPEAERLIAQLSQRAPGSPELRQAQNLLKMHGPEGKKDLLQARLLATAGRYQEAEQAYRQLFGDDLPDFAMSLEYLTVRGRIDALRADSIEQLRALDRQYPGNSNLRLTLANQLFAAQRDAEALAVLHQLASDPTAADSAADREYGYLLKQPLGDAAVQGWQTFVQLYPNSPFHADAGKQLQTLRQQRVDPVRLAAIKNQQALKASNDPWALLKKADQALARKDYPAAKRLYQQVRQLQPQSVQALTGLAEVARAESDPRTAEALLLQASQLEPGNAGVMWALFRLYRSQSADRAEQYLASLPAARQVLFQSVRPGLALERLNAQADDATRRSDWAQLAQVLDQARERDPDNPWLVYRLANAQRQLGRNAEAEANFNSLLQRQGHNPEARYAHALFLASAERSAEAMASLQQIPRAAWSDNMRQLWQRLLQQQALAKSQAQLSWRDKARLIAAADPQRALDDYAQSMAAMDLISPQQAAPRDDRALTAASRANDSDDWLQRSVRADVDELYQKQNVTLNLYHDYAWRTDDSASGVSDLTTQTTILRVDAPLAQGQAFMQAEQVQLDTSSMASSDRFGLCAVVQGGCASHGQSVNGTQLGLGWHDDTWAFDVGHTPQEFTVSNWVGGVSYSGDLDSIGYRLTASRRPVSNSLVSYAGAVDPVTGKHFGGVTANGFTLNLSHDQGGKDGVWASLSNHWLVGENVADNQRRSVMGGYYYRLLENADERVRTGLTLMYMGYDKDLSESTLGEGGYYSPQQYYSASVPINFAWRNADWSVFLESAVGWSFAKVDSSDLYPKDSSAAALQSLLSQSGQTLADDATLSSTGSSSSGVNYRVQGVLERRLSDNLVLGTGVTWQHSEGYAPSRALLYLRYSFDPWQGNLPLPVAPVTPYAEMR